MKTVPIPTSLAQLERDPRGYPIPYMVYRDGQGRPHFQINDVIKVRQVMLADWCGLCGHPITGTHWFVGGPQSAWHPQGMYSDQAMHHECMRYAVQVCPFLAAPNYSKRIDHKTLKKGDEEGTYLLLHDQNVIPDRPAVFVCVEALGQELISSGPVLYARPRRPVLNEEFWRKGVPLTRDRALAFIRGKLSRK